MYDIIIVGGGPAGMTAALYALRNGKSVLVLEKTGFGGQIVHSPKVENWPGTARMSGNEYADHFLEQILDQGAEVDLTEVVRVEDHGDRKTVTTADGETREARSVILATGVRHRELGLTGTYRLYDLWQHEVVGTVSEEEPISVTLAPTASAVFRLI